MSRNEICRAGCPLSWATCTARSTSNITRSLTVTDKGPRSLRAVRKANRSGSNNDPPYEGSRRSSNEAPR